MIIILSDLKKICTALFKTTEKYGDTISYYMDDYWTIQLNDSYKPIIAKSDICVGSLAWDWEWVEKVLNKKNMSITIDFDRIGNLIAFSGYELFRPEEEKKGWHFTVKRRDLLELYLHLLSKAEDAGFEDIDITIDSYWFILPHVALDFKTGGDCEFVLQSFVNDWQELKKFDSTREPTLKDFEQLGRTLKRHGLKAVESKRRPDFLLVSYVGFNYF